MPLPTSTLHLDSWWRTPPYWLGAIILCVLVAMLWYPSLDASFQFDDWNVIVNEARVQSLAAWAQSMPGIRPLLKFSYALNNTLSREPYGFRLFNVCVHAGNAVVIFGLFARKSSQWGYNSRAAYWAGLITALIFAFHPLQTEAVTYISGRSSSLATLFSLASLYAWQRHECADTARAQRGWLSLCGLALLLAVAVKETALTLPLLLWLWSISNPGAAFIPKKIWVPLLISVLLAGAALCLPTYQHLLTFSLNIRPLADNLLTQTHALLYLAGQLLRIEHVNIDPQLTIVTQLTPITAVLLCLWLALVAWSMWRIRSSSASAFALLWFLICLLPTHSMLARLDIVNDRQLYLALAGPAWLLALYAIKLHAEKPKLAIAAVLLLLTALAYSTAARNKVYATEISFWKTAAVQNPDSARVANNLGLAYALDCQPQAASAAFRRTAALDPQDFHARINLRLLQQDQLPGVAVQRCAR